MPWQAKRKVFQQQKVFEKQGPTENFVATTHPAWGDSSQRQVRSESSALCAGWNIGCTGFAPIFLEFEAQYGMLTEK